MSEFVNCQECQCAVNGKLNTDLKTPRICTRHPPQFVALPTPQGMAMISAFPTIDEIKGCFDGIKQDGWEHSDLEVIDPTT